MILPLVLFTISILVWSFSLLLLLYKSEIDEFQTLKLSNNNYWRMENISKIAEYEVFKGDVAVKTDKYRDIIEYFEDYDLVWIQPNKVSKSGFQRYALKRNNQVILGDVVLLPETKNILEIKLIKEILIEEIAIEIIVEIYYEYLRAEGDLFKSDKREIKGVESRIKYENIRD